jgi:urea transporter
MGIAPSTLLRGMSNIMLQKNVATGLLFLIGIFYNSWIMGLGAVLGLLFGTLTAFVLNYKREDILDGYYGFNGALVGVALPFFFEINALLIGFIVFGAALSSIIMNFMHERKLAPYTFPFVLSTWILMLLVGYLGLLTPQTSALPGAASLDIIPSLTMGFGQVMFQANIITGIIFLLAILVNSRISAAYAFVGSLVGMLLAFSLSFPLNLVNIGIFGFNGVLCGIAFAGTGKSSFLYALFSIILSVFIIYGMISINWVALTSPFVFAAWITLILRDKILARA